MIISLSGKRGADGKSAYQTALDNGFQGTEAEWLESLKGKKVKLQEKNYSITSNGTTVIAPDEGFQGVCQGTIDVNIPSTGSGTEIQYDKIGVSPEDAAEAEKVMKDYFLNKTLAAKAEYEATGQVSDNRDFFYGWMNKDVLGQNPYIGSNNIIYLPTLYVHNFLFGIGNSRIKYIGHLESPELTTINNTWRIAGGGDIGEIVFPKYELDRTLFGLVPGKKVWKASVKLNRQSLKGNSSLEDIDFMGFKQDASLDSLDMRGTSALTEAGWLHLADTLTAPSGTIIVYDTSFDLIPQTVKDTFASKGWTISKYVTPALGAPVTINVAEFIATALNNTTGQIRPSGVSYTYNGIKLTFLSMGQNCIGAYTPEFRLYMDTSLQIEYADGSAIGSLSLEGGKYGGLAVAEASGNGSFAGGTWTGGLITDTLTIASLGRVGITAIHINE